MRIDIDDLLNSINSGFDEISFIKPEEIPDIDLYMDQVTTFMDSHLKNTARNISEEKLMTKTMINNYAKSDVIPAPVKKKYSKDHILLLIMVYYLKSILQINDIKGLMGPFIDRFFDSDGEFGIEDVYQEVLEGMRDNLSEAKEDVLRQYSKAMDSFSLAPESDQEYLKLYNFICRLSCDVFVKKLLIEKIVDSIMEHREEASKDEKSETPEKKTKK